MDSLLKNISSYFLESKEEWVYLSTSTNSCTMPLLLTTLRIIATSHESLDGIDVAIFHQFVVFILLEGKHRESRKTFLCGRWLKLPHLKLSKFWGIVWYVVGAKHHSPSHYQIILHSQQTSLKLITSTLLTNTKTLGNYKTT